jgi:Domain of unknown function (DUF4263)
MTGEESKTIYRRSITITPGQPIELTDLAQRSDAGPVSAVSKAIALTLKSYLRAGRELVDGAYRSVRDLAPPIFRVPCHVYAVCCPDGVLVRYDAAGAEEPMAGFADSPESLAKVSAQFSDYLVHSPDDPATYVPEHLGPSVALHIRGEYGTTELAQFSPLIIAPKMLPAGFPVPRPSERPPCLASVNREIQLEVHGEIPSSEASYGAISSSPEQFIARIVTPLPVGWQAIEIYPRLDETYWKPEYAGAWAKHDLESAIAQRNAIEMAFYQLDGRGAARDRYAEIIGEFEALLSGPEEPCHQFLKSHPELICPTHDAYWSKKVFGAHVSDFVFREPHNDYLLVEIEAPHRLLFRKDGHPRQALNHAISQIRDWVRFIQENKAKVEQELGLFGISAAPRSLVVIGRSSSLTEENRSALSVMQTDQPRLTILTYDDLLRRARTQLERLLGPFFVKGPNVNIYFFRTDRTSKAVA